MPMYEFYCLQNAEHITEEFYEISSVPLTSVCAVCGAESRRFQFPRRIYIGKGIQSRVYQQWIGNPDACPADLKETLKKQDIPKSRSWYRSSEERYGEEEARWRKKLIQEGLARRREQGVKYKIGSGSHHA